MLLGQYFCVSDRLENLCVSAATAPHSPGKYRVNGVVINMPQFEKALRASRASR